MPPPKNWVRAKLLIGWVVGLANCNCNCSFYHSHQAVDHFTEVHGDWGVVPLCVFVSVRVYVTVCFKDPWSAGHARSMLDQYLMMTIVQQGGPYSDVSVQQRGPLGIPWKWNALRCKLRVRPWKSPIFTGKIPSKMVDFASQRHVSLQGV